MLLLLLRRMILFATFPVNTNNRNEFRHEQSGNFFFICHMNDLNVCVYGSASVRYYPNSMCIRKQLELLAALWLPCLFYS